MKSPGKQKETPEAVALRERQVLDLAELDEQKNIKIKRMQNASRGSRVFAGSSLSRAAPGNTAGKPLFAPRGAGGGGVAGGASAPYGGGLRGSRGVGSMR